MPRIFAAVRTKNKRSKWVIRRPH